MDSISLALCFGLVAASAVAEAPRVLPAGKLPQDARLQPLKDLDGYFPFTPSASPADWERRAEWVRRQMLVSFGLWPLPTRTPLNAVVHGRVERDDYTVEKVYFESMPGFFVTGSLYRPKGRSGRLPGILCPHGHWNEGRFLDTPVAEVRKEIERGAERFEEGGRSVLQARCVQLARLGCVVFHYDMIGYADSVQIPLDLAHGFKKQRPEMNARENWGLFSPQAESHNQSVMGLQTWNSLRALDFLLSLVDVDADRVGCTGASGGGTQTFILSALDPRVRVAFPAVMVSTAMQGGCTCENACGLRVDTGNVEFAALFAPKPLGMTAADDWTKEMPTKGFPELQRHYAMLGAADKVQLTPLLQFGHNYNAPSRAAMYTWFNRHLGLSAAEPIVERDFQRLTRTELSVWDDRHPRPGGGAEFERRLLRWWNADAQKQLQAAGKSPEDFRRVMGGAIQVVIGRTFADAGDMDGEIISNSPRGSYSEILGLSRNTTHGEEIPVVVLQPAQRGNRLVFWIDPAGKQGLFANAAASGETRPRPEIQRLLDAGVIVAGVDLFLQGEFLADGKPVQQTHRVANPREAAAYTFGYNHTLFAQRAHDLLTLIRFTRTRQPQVQRVDLVGLAGAGPWVAAACAVSEGAVNGAAIDTGGFRFANVTDAHSPDFLPGGAKYGDLPGMLALAAPASLWITGEPQPLDAVKSAYAQAGRADKLTLAPGAVAASATAAVDWLLSQKD